MSFEGNIDTIEASKKSEQEVTKEDMRANFTAYVENDLTKKGAYKIVEDLEYIKKLQAKIKEGQKEDPSLSISQALERLGKKNLSDVFEIIKNQKNKAVKGEGGEKIPEETSNILMKNFFDNSIAELSKEYKVEDFEENRTEVVRVQVQKNRVFQEMLAELKLAQEKGDSFDSTKFLLEGAEEIVKELAQKRPKIEGDSGIEKMKKAA